MRTSRVFKSVRLVVGAAIVAPLLSSVALGAVSLTAVPFVATDTTNTAQGLTPDGKYLTGTSGTGNGYVYNTVNGNLYTMDRTSGSRLLMNGNGIGYRTHSGANQLVVAGTPGTQGFEGFYTLDLSTEPGASGAWTTPTVVLTTAESNKQTTSTYNTLAMEGIGSELGFIAKIQGTSAAKAQVVVLTRVDATNSNAKYDNVGAGGGSATGGGVATNGVVGHQKQVSGVNSNYTAKYNFVTEGAGIAVAGATRTNTLIGSASGAIFAVAANGSRMAGYNPAAGTNAYAFDVDSNGLFTAAYQLPTPGATSTSLAYGMSANGQYAVGQVFPGVGKAYLWDLTNTASIQAIDLTAWASSQGILGTWTRLARATSVGIDGSGNLIITGIGTHGTDTQAFVLTYAVPEPASVAFLALGGVALLRRRRAK